MAGDRVGRDGVSEALRFAGGAQLDRWFDRKASDELIPQGFEGLDGERGESSGQRGLPLVAHARRVATNTDELLPGGEEFDGAVRRAQDAFGVLARDPE